MKRTLGLIAVSVGLVGVTVAGDASAVYMVHSGMLCVPENEGPYALAGLPTWGSSFDMMNAHQVNPLGINCPIPRNNMSYHLQELRIWADNNNDTTNLTCKAYLFDEWGAAVWSSTTVNVPHNTRTAITWTMSSPYSYYNYHFYSVDCTLPPAEGGYAYDRSAILGFDIEEQP